MKRNKTERWHFTILPAGYGTYKVTYQSPVTGKRWTCKTHDMDLIDAFHNETIKRKELDTLKWLCKNS